MERLPTCNVSSMLCSSIVSSVLTDSRVQECRRLLQPSPPHFAKWLLTGRFHYLIVGCELIPFGRMNLWPLTVLFLRMELLGEGGMHLHSMKYKMHYSCTVKQWLNFSVSWNRTNQQQLQPQDGNCGGRAGAHFLCTVRLLDMCYVSKEKKVSAFCI